MYTAKIIHDTLYIAIRFMIKVVKDENTKSSTLMLVLEAGNTSHLLSEDFSVSEDPVFPLSLSSLAFCSA